MSDTHAIRQAQMRIVQAMDRVERAKEDLIAARLALQEAIDAAQRPEPPTPVRQPRVA